MFEGISLPLMRVKDDLKDGLEEVRPVNELNEGASPSVVHSKQRQIPPTHFRTTTYSTATIISLMHRYAHTVCHCLKDTSIDGEN